MMQWRTEARSLRVMELLDEANEPIRARPEAHQARVPQGLVLEEMIEKASHRHCVEMWNAYARCKDNRKGSHQKCAGWWTKYHDCLETTSPKLVLKMLEAVAQDDPDPNMDRLRQ